MGYRGKYDEDDRQALVVHAEYKSRMTTSGCNTECEVGSMDLNAARLKPAKKGYCKGSRTSVSGCKAIEQLA